MGFGAAFAVKCAGAGVLLEWAIPEIIPDSIRTGLSFRAEYRCSFLKDPLESDVLLDGGVWLRVPFSLATTFFAVRPEVSFGADIHCEDGVSVLPEVTARLCLCFVSLSHLKTEFSVEPFYTLAVENDKSASYMAGCRLGATLHLGRFFIT